MSLLILCEHKLLPGKKGEWPSHGSGREADSTHFHTIHLSCPPSKAAPFKPHRGVRSRLLSKESQGEVLLVPGQQFNSIGKSFTRFRQL